MECDDQKIDEMVHALLYLTSFTDQFSSSLVLFSLNSFARRS